MKTFEKTSITADTLSANLKEFRATGRKAKRQAQQLVLCAFGMFAKSGNADPLLRVYKACTVDNGMDKKVMLGFIQAHANVRLIDEGKKNAKFTKANKKPATVKPITGWWYDHEAAPKKEQPKAELQKMLTALVTRIHKQDEDGNLADDHKHALALVKYLESYEGLNTVDHVAPELKAVA